MGPSLKGRALRLLSNREHSKHELAQKLKQHAQSEDELLQVLEWLQVKGFINEQRVLESIIYRRAPKLGYARVARELQEKGLAAHAVTDAVKELKETEAERAKNVWLKKFKTPAQSIADKARQMRFLMSRGFAPSVVIQLLNEQTAFDNEGKKPSAEEEAELARLIDTLESD
jgi:regulatory protein